MNGDEYETEAGEVGKMDYGLLFWALSAEVGSLILVGRELPVRGRLGDSSAPGGKLSFS